MKTLYVSDLDGTLLRPDARLSEYTIRTLNRLIDGGLCFTYATARSLASASVVASGLTPRCPVIVYNGAFTLRADSGEVVDSVSFDGNQASEIARHLLDASVYPLVYAHIDGAERVSYLAGHESEGVAAYIRSRQNDARLRPVERAAELFAGDIFYFTCIGHESELRSIRERFQDDPAVNCLFQADIYRPADHWCELLPARATKGNAVLRLKQLLGCERVVSFGDGINDLSMFAISDECYAVNNAVDELKRAATGIIPSNAEDGVARFLAQIMAEVRA